MKTYTVSGYKMLKNEETWELEKSNFLAHIIVNSKLIDIDTFKDREFFEGEISIQLDCDWFEIISFAPNN
jgi:hypothetical protein